MLIDLIALVLIALAVLGGLREGRLLGALAAGAVTALGCWLTAAAVLAWAPAELREPVNRSALLRVVPAPVAAFDEAARLFDHGPGGGPGAHGR